MLSVLTALVVSGCGHDPNDKWRRRWRTDAGTTLADGGTSSTPTGTRDTNGGVDVVAITEPTYRNWSDPSAWPSGRKPLAGEDVTIPSGTAILLDENPPALGGLSVNGTLGFADTFDVALSAKWIMVHGRLRVGTPARPFVHRAVITLTDPVVTNDAMGMGMGTRGLMVMGGTLELVGVTPIPAWTHLGANAAAGASSLVLAESTNWRAGDRVAIAPTDLFRNGHTESFSVTSPSGNSVGLSSGLARARFGQQQTFANVTVDERAEVANLSRNIVIEAPDDATWREQRFGAHVMVMRGSLARFDGVEMRRVGQAGKTGRYPIHFHRLSYADDGSTIGDSPSYVRNVAVSGSKNRCIVLHATNGVRVFNNVCHEITGHAVFLEDAVERHNVIEWNLVMGVHNPLSGDTLQVHEGPIFQGGSSGYWITNPDNQLRRNVAADADGNGFWFSMPEHGLKLSKNVPIQPAYLPFGVFADNSAHSNQAFGMNFDWVSTDDAGNVTPFRYTAMVNGTFSSDYANHIDTVLERFTSYKNDLGGLWNRVERLRMRGFVMADNPGTSFAGSSTNCTITGSLVVGTSANNAIALPANNPPVGVASYHSQCDITNNTFVNLPFVAGYSSGAFKTDDYYVRAVDRGLVRNHDNTFINSSPGYRSPMPSAAERYALAGALWDPTGVWGPAGNFWVYDTPFLTAGGACQSVNPAGENGSSCSGPYYGVGQFVLDGSGDRYTPLMAIEVTRTDASNAVFTIANGSSAPKLGWMRHFAMRRGASYALRFPDQAVPRQVSMIIDSMRSADDYAMLGVQFQGGVPARAYLTTAYDGSESNTALRRTLTAATSLAAVASSSGDRFFQDSANNMVWIKVTGGLPFPYTPEPGSDDDLYRSMTLRVLPR